MKATWLELEQSPLVSLRSLIGDAAAQISTFHVKMGMSSNLTGDSFGLLKIVE